MASFCTLMSENFCEGRHIFTEQGLIGFKSGHAVSTHTNALCIHLWQEHNPDAKLCSFTAVNANLPSY